jgi:putative oxidoreductase
MRFVKALTPHLLSVLRIMTGLLLLQHGTGKWLGFPAGVQGYPASFSNLTFISSGTAGLFELVGGALIVLGLFTRPVAFILSGMCAVAYFKVHGGFSSAATFFPILNRGELAVLYTFVFFYMFAAGGGPWSLDRLFGISKD